MGFIPELYAMWVLRQKRETFFHWKFLNSNSVQECASLQLANARSTGVPGPVTRFPGACAAAGERGGKPPTERGNAFSSFNTMHIHRTAQSPNTVGAVSALMKDMHIFKRNPFLCIESQ